MRTLILATAALLCGTGAMAQVTITTTDASGATTQGPTTKVLRGSDQVAVHQVNPDGTVLVKTMTAKEAETAMKSGETPQLALADTGMTTGAAAADPAAPNVRGDLETTLAVAPAMTAPPQAMTTQKTTVSGSTRTTTTVQVVPKAMPAPAPAPAPAMTTGAGERG